MKNRTSRALGLTAAAAALAALTPLAVTAQAEPTTPVTVKAPDPQGPGCDPIKAALAAQNQDPTTLSTQTLGGVLAKIPSISTFYSAVSGGLNPAVNVLPVLENGPYVVFAPTNDAFAALDPAVLANLKSDPAALTSLDYYHVFLGLLGNDDLKGQRPSQEGTEVKVTGSGGDLVFNDSAKLVCGAFQSANARIYIIDKVLDKANAPARIAPGSTSTSGATTTPTTTPATPAPVAPPAG